ncbi:MAG: hypothetical protein QM523_03475, partial [Candidatus Pacebacteria bacterium]|nr:hypothetical protein [Candidatus Paceibacterota bacterium]
IIEGLMPLKLPAGLPAAQSSGGNDERGELLKSNQNFVFSCERSIFKTSHDRLQGGALLDF